MEQKIAKTRQSQILLSSLVTILFCLTSCTNNTEQLPYFTSPDFTPHFLTDKTEIDKQIHHKVNTFSFTNQRGSTINSEDSLVNKVHVANFIFTSCGSICPTMTKNLKVLESKFGNRDDFAFLSFSVTPWKDSVPVLREYAKGHNIHSNNWHFLTGQKGKIYELARKSYFAEEDIGYKKDSTEFLHTEHIILVDKNRRIRGIYNGTLPLEIEQMGKDIESLLKE